jgi:type IV secretory pathway TraG/TraD family ATPase VirD4
MLAPLVNEHDSGVRMVLFDYKHDMLSWLSSLGLKCPIISLNPFHADSVGWDMAKDIDEPAQVLGSANILFPIDEETSNAFWQKALQSFYIEIVNTFMERAPGAWTFRDVINTLLDRNRLLEVLSLTASGREVLDNYANEKVFNDVLATIDAHIKGAGYAIIAAIWDRSPKISLVDFVEGPPSILVLGKASVATEVVDRINQVIFQRLTQILLDRPEMDSEDPWRLFMVLDEAANMGQLPLLADAMTSLRSRNVSFTIAFQDINQWYKIYGDKIGEATLAQCANVMVLKCIYATAEWASKGIGNGEGWLKDRHKGEENSERMTTRPVVMPEEISGLPKASPANGVSGYFLTSDTHFAFACVRDAFEKRIPTDVARKLDFVRRPKAHQYRRGFDDADLLRLGFSVRRPLPELEASKAPELEKPTETPKRFRLRRPSTGLEQTSA